MYGLIDNSNVNISEIGIRSILWNAENTISRVVDWLLVQSSSYDINEVESVCAKTVELYKLVETLWDSVYDWGMKDSETLSTLQTAFEDASRHNRMIYSPTGRVRGGNVLEQVARRVQENLLEARNLTNTLEGMLGETEPGENHNISFAYLMDVIFTTAINLESNIEATILAEA